MLAVSARQSPRLRSLSSAASTVSSAAAAIVLLLLFAAWFELTFYEAWLTPARWLRFPVLVSRAPSVASGGGNLLGSPSNSPAPSSSASRTRFSYDSVACSARRNPLSALRTVLIRAAGRLFRGVFNSATNGNGCNTRPDTLGCRRRDLRCYTARWFCPGDSPHRLTATRPETRFHNIASVSSWLRS